MNIDGVERCRRHRRSRSEVLGPTQLFVELEHHMLESWPRMPTAQDLVDASHSEIRLGDDEALHWMNLSSPRVRFLKSVPFDSHLIDVGAGDGNLEIFRRWLNPVRNDIKMYAVSLGKGSNFDAYEGYELGDFNVQKPDFGGRVFDAVMACHFVEHIDGGPAVFAAWAHGRLREEGRLYVEFPTLRSIDAPLRQEIVDLGLEVSTSNFHDDHTHQETISLEETREALEKNGFFIEESGYIRNPVIENEMLARGRRDNDIYPATVGMWMKTYFSQYVVGVRL